MLIIVFLITLLAFLVYSAHQKNLKNYPPGPFALPLFGNLPQILYYAVKSNGLVPMFSIMRKTYGDVFTLWLGPIATVNVTNFDVAHQLFVKDGAKFADKFNSPLLEHTREGTGIVAANGPVWNEQRKFALQMVKTFATEKLIMEEIQFGFAKIDGKISMNIFEAIVGNIINRVLIGKRFENEHQFHKLKTKMDESLEKVDVIDLLAPLWLLKVFFPSKFETQTRTQKETEEFIAHDAIERLKSARADVSLINEKPTNLIDAYVQNILEGSDETYNEVNMRAVLLDLWQTGQETTTTTIIAGINQLLHNREVIVKARQELNVIQSDWIYLKHRVNTPYFNAVINEIQRHASILNMNFWRINHEPITINGYQCARGAFITAQLSALHQNEDLFANPGAFDPQRFINDDKLSTKLAAFGLGKRSCIGEILARNELYLILANFIRNYEFEESGKLPDLRDLSPMGFAKRPEKCSLVVRKIVMDR